MKNLYSYICNRKKRGHKLFCVLIDPDKFNEEVVHECNRSKVHLFFVGGSSVKPEDFSRTVNYIKKHSKIPLVIFPGDTNQFSKKADALLYLSLISGRNPEYLIGKQVTSALAIKKSGVTCISTAYILVSGGGKSETERVSETRALPVANRKEILSTALAGELLGMRLVYLEAGSGAHKTLPPSLVRYVSRQITVPLIAGGGINSKAAARKILKAGADLIVVGNAIEKNLFLIKEISSLF